MNCGSEYYLKLLEKTYPSLIKGCANAPIAHVSSWEDVNNIGHNCQIHDKTFQYYCFELEHSSFSFEMKNGRYNSQTRTTYSTKVYLSDCCSKCKLLVTKPKDKSLSPKIERISGHDVKCDVGRHRKYISPEKNHASNILGIHPKLRLFFQNTAIKPRVNELQQYLKDSLHIARDFSKATLQRLINQHCEDIEKTLFKLSYDALPSFLEEFYISNPSTFLELESNEDGTFYRCVLVFPNSSQFLGESTLPIIITDACHPTGDYYDGRFVFFVTKTGNGENLPIAFALIPSESNESYIWLFGKLIDAGIDIENFPFFTDRGVIRTAASSFARRYGLFISLKYCTEHIIRSINSTFKVKEDDAIQIRNTVHSLQAASSPEKFVSILSQLEGFVAPNGQTAATYISKIHPTLWTVFGNFEYYDHQKYWDCLQQHPLCQTQEMTEITYFAGEKVHCGRPMRLFSVATTNVVEVENSVTKGNGIRKLHPPIAIAGILCRYKKTMHEIVVLPFLWYQDFTAPTLDKWPVLQWESNHCCNQLKTLLLHSAYFEIYKL
ncbi:hypothetical protein CTEN210_03623 [Chaetoceros tenuissimus]|uniref:MULE transposase domain-containing protein n=1 Tax=Chaetoceros tenuissimus TaxID=426638 RepID=A0AAD3H1Z3_9STRA|nr:hypothetical protein CTEN210_03623 [Chaetoceros tenuissimus]